LQLTVLYEIVGKSDCYAHNYYNWNAVAETSKLKFITVITATNHNLKK